jgi:HNH endonuclease
VEARPWQYGGLTERDNLITLCQTCHEGLDPHYEPSLQFKVVPPLMPSTDGHRELWEGVRRYREIVGDETVPNP